MIFQKKKKKARLAGNSCRQADKRQWPFSMKQGPSFPRKSLTATNLQYSQIYRNPQTTPTSLSEFIEAVRIKCVSLYSFVVVSKEIKVFWGLLVSAACTSTNTDFLNYTLRTYVLSSLIFRSLSLSLSLSLISCYICFLYINCSISLC
jgi:hypothetical protein